MKRVLAPQIANSALKNKKRVVAHYRSTILLARNRAFACLVIVLVTSGCTTGRLGDLMDCGKVSVGFGGGLSTDLGIGVISHPSLGLAAQTSRIGIEDRDVYGYWSEGEMAFPVILLPASTAEAQSKFCCPYNLSYSRRFNEVHGESETEMSRLDGWINCLDGHTPPRSLFNRATNLEAGATLGIVAVRVGINPLEIVDLFLGFFGIDIADDDTTQEDSVAPGT